MFDTIAMHHATRAKAEKLQAMLAAEYPRLSLSPVPAEESDRDDGKEDLASWDVIVDSDDDNTILATEDKHVPEIADILDACAEQEIDPTASDEDDEDQRQSGSVVAETYRQAYRVQSSTGTTCGDWLAERLTADTTGADGKVNIADLTHIFETNGLDLRAKWANPAKSNGWQGRYRMSGRLALEKRIALARVYRDHQGAVIHPHAEWLDANDKKHAKFLEKEAKRAAAAEAAIRAAVGGGQN